MLKPTFIEHHVLMSIEKEYLFLPQKGIEKLDDGGNGVFFQMQLLERSQLQGNSTLTKLVKNVETRTA